MYSRVGVSFAQKPLLFLRLSPVVLICFLTFAVGILSAFRQSLGYAPGMATSSPSFHYFRQILSDEWFLRSAFFSLRVGFLSATLSILLGVPLAYLVWRMSPEMQKWSLVYKLPIILPHITVAFLVMVLLAPSGLPSSILYHLGIIDGQGDFPNLLYSSNGVGMIVAYGFKEIPFVMLMVLGVLPAVPEQMIHTAKMLGAGRGRVFFSVILPELYPVINTVFIILFLYGFGSFDIPYLLGGGNPGLLPVYVYNLYFQGSLAQRPMAMAALVLMFAFAFIFTLLYTKVAGHMDERTRKI